VGLQTRTFTDQFCSGHLMLPVIKHRNRKFYTSNRLKKESPKIDFFSVVTSDRFYVLEKD